MAARLVEHLWNGRDGAERQEIWLRRDGSRWWLETQEGGSTHPLHVWPCEGGEPTARHWLERFKTASKVGSWQPYRGDPRTGVR